MADRTVSVTLRARIEQYLAAMKAAARAPEEVSASAQRSFQRLGGQMQSAGRAATLGITTPLVAAGGAAVAMAGQFEGSFGRMVGLAGVPQSEIEDLKASVMELAGETGVAPQQLAEALYFLRSSGLDAGEAMDALEASARASAAGLGNTATIADAVSSAMNAYASSGLSAAEATDILVATARAGKAEPEELAGALGRVLPIASELGITFTDVGGALAALSLTGNDASTSATLLTNIMSKLLKPSQQGAQMLQEVGLSAQGIRDSIESNGLLATLEMLRARLGDNGFVRFLEDAQAVQGALTLVGDESGTVANAFQVVRDNAGATGDAFNAMASTDAHKMKQALVDVQTAMIELGTVLLPLAADIGSFIAELASGFADLPQPIQTAIAALGGLLAVAGPAVYIGGSLVKNWTQLATVFKGAGGAMGAASKAFGALGIAVGLGFIAYEAFTAEQRKTDDVTRNVTTALMGNMAAMVLAADAAASAAEQIDGVAIAQEALSLALGEGYASLTAQFGTFNIAGRDVALMLAQMQEAPVQAMDNLARSFGFTAEQADALAHSSLFAGSFGASAEALAEQIGAPVEQVEAFRIEYIKLQGLIDNVDTNAIAQQFLNAQVSAHGLEDSMVGLAEEQSNQNRVTGDAMAVLYQWAVIMAQADAETQDAILGTSSYEEALANLTPAMRALVDPTYEAVAGIEALSGAGAHWQRIMGTVAATNSGIVAGFDDINDALPQSERVILAASEALLDYATNGADAAEQIARSFGGDMLSDSADNANGLAREIAGVIGEMARFGDVTDKTATDLSKFINGTLTAEQAVDAFSTAFQTALGPARSWIRTHDDFSLALLEFNDQIDHSTHSLDYNTESGLANRAAVFDMADSIIELTESNIQAGRSQAEVTEEYEAARTALLDAAEAAGLNRADVEKLIREYGLVPELVETTVSIAGRAFAEWQIQEYRQRLDALPENEQTWVRAIADSGSIAHADALLRYLERTRYTKIFVSTVVSRSASLAGLMNNAVGGYKDRPEIGVWGEAGAEAMFPLTRPSRIRELWSDPRISGPMLAALSSTPMGNSAPVVNVAAPSSGTVMNFYVTNNGRREITRHDLAAAVRDAVASR